MKILSVCALAAVSTQLPGTEQRLAAEERPATPLSAVRINTESKTGEPLVRRPTYFTDVQPIVMGKCARCHSGQELFLRNWLDYDITAADRWEVKRRIWDSWTGSFFKQPMPPANSPEAQAMTEEERRTIRDWVETGALRGQPYATGSKLSKAERIEEGKRLFSTVCAACHQPNAHGIPGRFPPLAGSDFLNADKHRAIRIVLNGLQGDVVVNGQKFNNSMPKLPLNDQQIASALTYVYNSFGNSGQEVRPEEVGAARLQKEDTLTPTSQHLTAKPSEEKSPWE